MKLSAVQRDHLEWLAGQPFGFTFHEWNRRALLGTRKRDGKEIILEPVTVRKLAERKLIKLGLEYRYFGQPMITITKAGRKALGQ